MISIIKNINKSVLINVITLRASIKYSFRNIVKLRIKKPIIIRCNVTSDKKVAISYLGDHRTQNHTNYEQQSIIINIFNEMGFEVHLYSNNVIPLCSEGVYNIVFGFGVCWRYLCQYNNDAVKILYGTEAPPYFSCIREIAALKRISGNKLMRTFRFYNDNDYLMADYLIQIGRLNKSLSEIAYPNLGERIHEISNYGIYHSTSAVKKVNTGKYLWFGSFGANHKGLDLVIAAGKKLCDIEIYVAGCCEREFRDIKGNCIVNNVHYVGVLDPHSTEFLKFIDRMSFVIMPSASEAVSTSVLTCAYHGLIPIITRETNIEFEGVIYVKNIDDLVNSIETSSRLSDDNYAALSIKCMENVKRKFGKDEFQKSFGMAISQITQIGSII